MAHKKEISEVSSKMAQKNLIKKAGDFYAMAMYKLRLRARGGREAAFMQRVRVGASHGRRRFLEEAHGQDKQG